MQIHEYTEHRHAGAIDLDRLRFACASLDWKQWRRFYGSGLLSAIRYALCGGHVAPAIGRLVEHERLLRRQQCHTYDGLSYQWCDPVLLARGQSRAALARVVAYRQRMYGLPLRHQESLWRESGTLAVDVDRLSAALIADDPETSFRNAAPIATRIAARALIMLEAMDGRS